MLSRTAGSGLSAAFTISRPEKSASSHKHQEIKIMRPHFDFYPLMLTLALALMAPAHAYEPTVKAGAEPALDAIALADHGLTTALAALPELVNRTLERSGVPGAAVAVVHEGKTVFAQGFGVRELDRHEPIDPSTVFQIASISKSLTATVIAMAVTSGRAREH